MTRPDKAHPRYGYYASSYYKAFIRNSYDDARLLKNMIPVSLLMRFIQHEDKAVSVASADYLGIKPVKKNLHIAFELLIKRPYPKEVTGKLKTLKERIDSAYTSDAIMELVYDAEDLIKGLPVK
jgi:hypothetical protein